MTTAEAQKALNVSTTDYVYRLARAGNIRAHKDERGRWVFDPSSVRAYVQRVESKRSSKSNRAAERERLKAEAAARFTR